MGKPYKNMEELCANCGKDAGSHGFFHPNGADGGGECPVGTPDGGLYFSATSKFKAMSKADKHVAGTVPVNAKLYKPKNAKKEKTWEPKKFNTPKQPKGDIKYYKEVPEPKPENPCAEVQAEIDTIVMGDYADTDYKWKYTYYNAETGKSSPEPPPQMTATGADMLSAPTGKGKSVTFKGDLAKAIESLKEANAKPYTKTIDFYTYKPSNYCGYDQHWGPDYEEEKRKHGIKVMVSDFLERARGMHPQHVGEALIEFAEKRGHEYGYRPREIENLRDHVSQQSVQIGQYRQMIRGYEKELAALKAEMAGMVKRSEVKVMVSPKGRKFKHEE